MTPEQLHDFKQTIKEKNFLVTLNDLKELLRHSKVSKKVLDPTCLRNIWEVYCQDYDDCQEALLDRKIKCQDFTELKIDKAKKA